MNGRKLYISILLLCLIYSVKSQSFDTLNKVDLENKKQGYWIIKFKYNHYVCLDTTQTKEEGLYKNNIKVGIWKEYYCNGIIRNELSFYNGRPDGECKLYFENGKIKEEGTWKNNRWVGKYKIYDDKGKVTEYFFKSKGRREGITIYPF